MCICFPGLLIAIRYGEIYSKRRELSMKLKKVFKGMACKAALIACFSLLCAFKSFAATHYVSPNGSASWAGSTNINTPCSPTTAMANAVADDIVYFRGGTYWLGQSDNNNYIGVLNPANSGTDGHPITFAAYPGETPVMDTHLSGDIKSKAFGNALNNYIVYDGFTLTGDEGASAGGITFMGPDINNKAVGLVVRNCTFIGPSSPTTSVDNIRGLSMQNVYGTLIQNCKFYNFRQVNDYPNTSAIGMYTNDHTTIEHCEFYNNTAAIYDKQGNNNATYRYNYMHDNSIGIEVNALVTGSGTYNARNGQIYHNVITNSGYAAILLDVQTSGADENNWQIYNNTIYNSGSSTRLVSIGTGDQHVVYNNIMIGNGSEGTYRNVLGSQLTTSDYNQFGTMVYIEKEGNFYSSLGSWQSSGSLANGGNPDTHSMASNPMFQNASGGLRQLGDFRLASNSPCKGAGYNGADMGANIDLVGIATGGNKAPNPPSNLK